MRMSFVGSIAANAQNDNVFSGKLHEFLGEHSRMVLAATGSAAGSRLSLLIGGGGRRDDQKAGWGARLPQLPQHFVRKRGRFPTERTVTPVLSTTAVSVTVAA